MEEQLNIKAALEHSLSHNNLMIDINFDEVSIVLPNKHIYEGKYVVYFGGILTLFLRTIASLLTSPYPSLSTVVCI